MFFVFPQPIGMFLNFRYFSASRSYTEKVNNRVYNKIKEIKEDENLETKTTIHSLLRRGFDREKGRERETGRAGDHGKREENFLPLIQRSPRAHHSFSKSSNIFIALACSPPPRKTPGNLGGGEDWPFLLFSTYRRSVLIFKIGSVGQCEKKTCAEKHFPAIWRKYCLCRPQK